MAWDRRPVENPISVRFKQFSTEKGKKGGGQGLRYTTHLAFAVGPEIDGHADEVVDARVGALVHEQGGEAAERVDDEADLDAAVEARVGERGEGPLPGERDEAEEQVEDLQKGNGADGAVEVGGEEVPEDLGPEEALEGGGDLVQPGRQDDEAGPVVFDQFAHLFLFSCLFGWLSMISRMGTMGLVL